MCVFFLWLPVIFPDKTVILGEIFCFFVFAELSIWNGSIQSVDDVCLTQTTIIFFTLLNSVCWQFEMRISEGDRSSERWQTIVVANEFYEQPETHPLGNADQTAHAT